MFTTENKKQEEEGEEENVDYVIVTEEIGSIYHNPVKKLNDSASGYNNPLVLETEKEKPVRKDPKRQLYDDWNRRLRTVREKLATARTVDERIQASLEMSNLESDFLYTSKV